MFRLHLPLSRPVALVERINALMNQTKPELVLEQARVTVCGRDGVLGRGVVDRPLASGFD